LPKVAFEGQLFIAPSAQFFNFFAWLQLQAITFNSDSALLTLLIVDKDAIL